MSAGRFIRILPDLPDPTDPGWRLALTRDEHDILATLSEERTLPEQVGNPDAAQVHYGSEIAITRTRLQWLHDVTGELLAAWPEGT